MSQSERRFHLLINCKDRSGIVASISQLIARFGGFILQADQHSDMQSGWFFMRYVLDLSNLTLSDSDFYKQLAYFTSTEDMNFSLVDKATQPKVLLLATKEEHCLADLLYRWRSAELPGEIIGVASNHKDLQHYAKKEKLPFHCFPIKNNKDKHFDSMEKLFKKTKPDVIVLARYMQIIPKSLCERYAGKMINIHHSFLPSFSGENPYKKAHDRGVKLIGATAHYVTEDLDEGPIIEQGVVRITHRDSVADCKRLGRDVERQVLAKALRAHLEDRVICHQGKTLVF